MWAMVMVAMLLAAVGCSSSSPSSGRHPTSAPPQNPTSAPPPTAADTSTIPASQLQPITQDGLQAKLQQFGGLDSTYASCVAKALYPQLTDDERRELNQPNPPDAITEAVVDKAQVAGANC